jgi:hypothetical protein
MAPTLKLTYFDIQGVAEKIRLAFHLGGVEFEDVRIGFPEWAAMKPTTPYGQLPIMSIDGAPPMAQSDAMLRYAGRLANQNGVLLYGAHNELAIDEAMGLVCPLPHPPPRVSPHTSIPSRRPSTSFLLPLSLSSNRTYERLKGIALGVIRPNPKP